MVLCLQKAGDMCLVEWRMEDGVAGQLQQQLGKAELVAMAFSLLHGEWTVL